MTNDEIREQCLTHTCNYFKLSLDEFRKKWRDPDLVLRRSFFFKLCVDKGVRGLLKIANDAGLKNHATVIHNVRSLNDQLDVDRNTRALWDDFCRSAHPYRHSPIKGIYLRLKELGELDQAIKVLETINLRRIEL